MLHSAAIGRDRIEVGGEDVWVVEKVAETAGNETWLIEGWSKSRPRAYRRVWGGKCTRERQQQRQWLSKRARGFPFLSWTTTLFHSHRRHCRPYSAVRPASELSISGPSSASNKVERLR